MDPAGHGSVLSALSLALHGQADEGATLAVALERALADLPGADLASVAVRTRRAFQSATASDLTATHADQLQLLVHEGPTLAAVETSAWQRTGRAAHDTRWRAWGERVAELGIRSAVSIPLLVDATAPLGALTVYSRARDRFPLADRELHEQYAALVAVAWSAVRRADGLRTALESRRTIGVAIGILAERYDLDTERAFAVLQRHSSHLNRKLRDVADTLVTTRRLPTAPSGLTTLDAVREEQD